MSTREKIILMISVAGLVLASSLVLSEIELRGYNPSLGIIPSCYVFANAFLLIILSVFLENKSMKSISLILGITVGVPISIYFSATHLIMVNPSPSIYSVPSSYVFAVFYISVALVRYLVIRK